MMHSKASYPDARDTGTPVNRAHAGLKKMLGPSIFIKPDLLRSIVAVDRNAQN